MEQCQGVDGGTVVKEAWELEVEAQWSFGFNWPPDLEKFKKIVVCCVAADRKANAAESKRLAAVEKEKAVVRERIRCANMVREFYMTTQTDPCPKCGMEHKALRAYDVAQLANRIQTGEHTEISDKVTEKMLREIQGS